MNAAKQVRRKLDREHKQQHLPTLNADVTTASPFVIAVVGPPKVCSSFLISIIFLPHTINNYLSRSLLYLLTIATMSSPSLSYGKQVGKSTLIKSLVRHYTRHNLTEIKGPVTVVSGTLLYHTIFSVLLVSILCWNDLPSSILSPTYIYRVSYGHRLAFNNHT